MKKLFTLVSAFALLVGCAKEEVVNLNPQTVNTSDAITFSVDDEATKAEYQFDAVGEEWNSIWYAEEDRMGVVFADAAFNNAAGTKIEAPAANDYVELGAATDFKGAQAWSTKYGWATAAKITAVDAPQPMAKMSFKATRTEMNGIFTAVDDASRLFFSTMKRGTPEKPVNPSFRVVYPDLDVQMEVTNMDPAATDADIHMWVAPVLSEAQVQNDLKGSTSSAVIDGLVLPEDPEINDDLENNSPRSANTAISLSLKRQYAVAYFKISGYNDLFGKLKAITFTTTSSTIAYADAKAPLVDIYDLKDGKYETKPVAGYDPAADAKKSIILSFDGGAGLTWDDEATAYIGFEPFKVGTANEAATVKYEFENISFTKEITLQAGYEFVANNFYPMNALDLEAIPYLVLGPATSKTLIINPCFYDHLEGIEDIFVKDAASGAYLYVEDNAGVSVPVAEFVKVIDKTTTPFDPEAVAVLNLLVKVKDAEYNAATQTVIPNYGTTAFNGKLAMPNLTGLEADVVTKLHTMTGITELDLHSLASVPAKAFKPLTALTFVDISSAQSIGAAAFAADFTNLTEISNDAATAKILISGSLTSIGNDAFRGFSSLVKVNLPAVTSIGNKAFWGCGGVTTLNMPVITNAGIESDAFGDTQTPYASEVDNLAYLYMPQNNFASAFVRAHLIKDILIEADLSAVTDFYEYLDVTPGVKLEGYTALVKLTIGAADIHKGAFNGCTNLHEINLEVAKSIEDEAFMNCYDLAGHDDLLGHKTLTVNVNPGKSAFENAGKSLEGFNALVFGNKVTTLAENSFKGAGNVFDVTLNNVNTIGKSAFEGSLVVNGVVLKNVSSIGEAAFKGCIHMLGQYEAKRDANVMYIGTALENGVSAVPASAFEGCDKVAIYDVKGDVLTVGDKAFFQAGTSRVGKVTVINFLANNVMIANHSFINVVADATSTTWKEDNTSTPLHTINFYGKLNGDVNNYTTNLPYQLTVAEDDVDNVITVTRVNKLNER